MEEAMLQLLPGVRAAEENGRFGVTLNGRTRLAADEGQTVFLRALLTGAQPLNRLLSLLPGAAAPDDAFRALTLADFILNFKDFLQP
jgi:hypothetical protein